jgi:hypothetical protein
MKLKLTLAGLTTAALLVPAAYAQSTGTSHPEQLNDQIMTSPNYSAAPHYVKPSPAIPAPAADIARVPDDSTSVPQTAAAPQTSPDATYVGNTPAAAIVQPVAQTTQIREGRRPLTSASDSDANIITSVPDVPGQLNEGTVLRARLQTPLTTQNSHVGDTFLAEVVQAAMQHGVVLIPVGAQIRGRISSVHGGRRFTGRASIRLQPDFITFPDGTSRRLHAELVDLDNFSDAHVNSEGTIIGTEHPKATIAAVGLTTASATVAGAMIGGGVGAAVGAGIGVGAGAIWFLKRDVQQELPAGTGLVFSLDEPLAVSSNPQTAELAH